MVGEAETQSNAWRCEVLTDIVQGWTSGPFVNGPYREERTLNRTGGYQPPADMVQGQTKREGQAPPLQAARSRNY